MNVLLNSNGSIANIELDMVKIAAGEYYGDDMVNIMEKMGDTQSSSGGTIMSNWFFVIGVSVATLAISVVLGILLAKKRIKKGFDLYED